jgi:hypothetical protein
MHTDGHGLELNPTEAVIGSAFEISTLLRANQNTAAALDL